MNPLRKAPTASKGHHCPCSEGTDRPAHWTPHRIPLHPPAAPLGGGGGGGGGGAGARTHDRRRRLFESSGGQVALIPSIQSSPAVVDGTDNSFQHTSTATVAFHSSCRRTSGFTEPRKNPQGQIEVSCPQKKTPHPWRFGSLVRGYFELERKSHYPRAAPARGLARADGSVAARRCVPSISPPFQSAMWSLPYQSRVEQWGLWRDDEWFTAGSGPSLPPPPMPVGRG